MNTSQALHYRSNLPGNSSPNPLSRTPILKFNTSVERNIMKAFLLSRLHLFVCDLFHNKIQLEKNYFSMECYTVDSKIIQFLIKSIVDTGEYTLEGIAYYTRIPFDVIFDAACGNNVQLSITLWVRVIHLYMQVKPDVARLLFDKLNEIKDKDHLAVSLLLNEQ